jgi:chorismate dehydratase
VSTKPIDQIRTVALDTSSRSSAALIQVLFAKHWRQKVGFARADPQLDDMLAKHDAALLIGDPALLVDRPRYLTWDLGEEWRNFTGKPFVFAFWAIRSGATKEENLVGVGEIFSRSRDEGLIHIEELADEWSDRLTLPRGTIVQYLSKNIHYRLDEDSIAGMQLFFRYAAELKILPPAPELRIINETEIRNSALANRL